MLDVGQFAPDFTLTNQYGEEVQLSEHRGRPVVLVFYPFAFSSVCTGEMCSLQDMFEEVQEVDALLLAVSTDTFHVLKAFANQESLDFDLLSDFWPHGQVAESYGVLDPEKGVPSRTTFLIDADGLILDRFTSAEMGTPRDTEAYRRALAKLEGQPA
ncbi:peroxiredoxin [Kocuria sp. JC486]|uniref:peroxiredoxin n=1 Tax=Kocuria sp. JC486 TaxID=1970736 RepID=UPI0014202730|nr:peroxiredoxin [Kocuria sp. JC486]NHU85747.1 peroxiredoxin [Kocuria sp. JC486]